MGGRGRAPRHIRSQGTPPRRCPRCDRGSTIFESNGRSRPSVGVIRALGPNRHLMGCQRCGHTWEQSV